MCRVKKPAAFPCFSVPWNCSCLSKTSLLVPQCSAFWTVPSAASLRSRRAICPTILWAWRPTSWRSSLALHAWQTDQTAAPFWTLAPAVQKTRRPAASALVRIISATCWWASSRCVQLKRLWNIWLDVIGVLASVKLSVHWFKPR